MIIRQGIDSKALLVTFLRKLPQIMLFVLAGAILGSGLYCMITLYRSSKAMFVSETEYYIDFSEGRIDAKDYYNAFTWNDVIATDEILGRMMAELDSAYNRNAVKLMIDADILSDVRYLTITIKGRDTAQVSAVNAAFEKAIAEFAKSKDEFDAIYKIEDNGISREQFDWFAWRAALLGAVVFAVIVVFFVALSFVIGDRFFTKTDITKFLELPALGLFYENGNEKDGLQEQRLIESIEALLVQYQKIYLLDGTDGRDAELFIKKFSKLGEEIDCAALYPCERYRTEESTVLLVIVPFGKVYREKITDEINNAVMHGGTIAGAVLTECDKTWVSMYYGKGVSA